MHRHYGNKEDITFKELFLYIMLFFIPVLLSVYASSIIAKYLAPILKVSIFTTMKILMIGFTLLIFFIIIPYIRSRESIHGVRTALFSFLIIAIVMTLPSAFTGNVGLLLNQMTYVASYIFITFIYSPEVLGVTRDIQEWFKRHKQLMVLLVYVSVVLFYILGFGWTYYEIALDNPAAFSYPDGMGMNYGNFAYYSLVTFATIGYGEITPVVPAAKLVVFIEAIIGLLINIVFIAILLAFVSNIQSIMTQKEEKVIKIEEKEIKDIKKQEKEDVKQIKALLRRVKTRKHLTHLEGVIKKAKKKK